MNGFDEFWRVFPSDRKQKKPACMAMFDAITSEKGFRTKDRDTGLPITLKATPDELIQGAKAYSVRISGSEYVCMPSTWMNQGRWIDHEDNEKLAAIFDAREADNHPDVREKRRLGPKAEIVRSMRLYAAQGIGPDDVASMERLGLINETHREAWQREMMARGQWLEGAA